jgi:nucleoside phosphorylase
MEASAIATVCELHGVPFLCVKDISNNELQGTTRLEFWVHFVF